MLRASESYLRIPPTDQKAIFILKDGICTVKKTTKNLSKTRKVEHSSALHDMLHSIASTLSLPNTQVRSEEARSRVEVGVTIS